jgi:hypothetical protein
MFCTTVMVSEIKRNYYEIHGKVNFIVGYILVLSKDEIKLELIT